jgi:hypothetical protein
MVDDAGPNRADDDVSAPFALTEMSRDTEALQRCITKSPAIAGFAVLRKAARVLQLARAVLKKRLENEISPGSIKLQKQMR